MTDISIEASETAAGVPATVEGTAPSSTTMAVNTSALAGSPSGTALRIYHYNPQNSSDPFVASSGDRPTEVFILFYILLSIC
jgi:hypothetical protein